MDARRREFVRRVLAASILLGVGGIAMWDLLEGVPPGRSSQSVTVLQGLTTQQSTQQATSGGSLQSTTQSVPPGYIFVTGMAALGGMSSAYFNHPSGGLSLLLNLSGQWKAFSAVCTHAGCTVNFTGTSIYCPCHAGYFSPSNGTVTGGPPPSPLPEYGVLIQGGNLYVTNAAIN